MSLAFRSHSLQTGHVFQDALPEADLYVLSGILQDLPGDKVHELLSRISNSCKPGETTPLT